MGDSLKQMHFAAQAHLNGLLPILGLCSDSERGHSAPLPSTVTVVHLNADEWRAGSGTVAAVDPELQDAEHEAGHEASTHASDRVLRLDRQLAE